MIDIKIPIPGKYENNYGIGNVYLKFNNIKDASIAREKLLNRYYNAKPMHIDFFSRKKYKKRKFKTQIYPKK